MSQHDLEVLLRHLRDDRAFATAVARDTEGSRNNRTSETLDRYISRRGAPLRLTPEEYIVAIDEAAHVVGQRGGGTTQQTDGCLDKRRALARARRALVWGSVGAASGLATAGASLAGAAGMDPPARETAVRTTLVTGAGGVAVAVGVLVEHVSTMIEAGQDLSRCLAGQNRPAESERLGQHMDRITEQLRQINERARRHQQRPRQRH